MKEKRKDEELKWIGVDFDDTIAKNTGYPDFEPLELLPGAREGIFKLVDAGYKIIIYTARSWNDHELVEDFLAENHIPFSRIICGKPLCYRIIDDRNGNWELAVNKILK